MPKIKHNYIEERKPRYHDIPPLLKQKLSAKDWIARIERVPRLSTQQRRWLAQQVWWDLDGKSPSCSRALRDYQQGSRAFTHVVNRDGSARLYGNNAELTACPVLCEAMVRIGMIVKFCSDCIMTKGLRR